MLACVLQYLHCRRSFMNDFISISIICSWFQKEGKLLCHRRRPWTAVGMYVALIRSTPTDLTCTLTLRPWAHTGPLTAPAEKTSWKGTMNHSPYRCLHISGAWTTSSTSLDRGAKVGTWWRGRQSQNIVRSGEADLTCQRILRLFWQNWRKRQQKVSHIRCLVLEDRFHRCSCSMIVYFSVRTFSPGIGDTQILYRITKFWCQVVLRTSKSCYLLESN